jgi:hypothetical protein
MEDLLLAFVTLVASSYIPSHLVHAGMDAFVIVTFWRRYLLLAIWPMSGGVVSGVGHVLQRFLGQLPFQSSTSLPRFPLSAK